MTQRASNLGDLKPLDVFIGASISSEMIVMASSIEWTTQVALPVSNTAFNLSQWAAAEHGGP
jgi:hypothetical protein